MGARAAMGLVVVVMVFGQARADPPATAAPEAPPEEAPEPRRARFLDSHVCPDGHWDAEGRIGWANDRFWALMALHSARLVALRDEKEGNPPTLMVSDRTFEELRAPIAAWAPTSEEVAAGAKPGPTPTHAAAGVLARIWGGEDWKTSPAIRDADARSGSAPPRWDVEQGTVDVGAW